MRHRSVVVVQEPVVEPVSLTDVRRQLRLSSDQTDDDLLLASLISTARSLIEKRLGVSLATKQLRATFDRTDLELELPYSPVLVDGDHPITVVVDVDTLSGADYELDTDRRPAILEVGSSFSGETVVTYWAGGSLQPQLRSAILLYVGHLYANREAVITDGSQPSGLPLAFETLLASESISGRW